MGFAEVGLQFHVFGMRSHAIEVVKDEGAVRVSVLLRVSVLGLRVVHHQGIRITLLLGLVYYD